MQLYPLPALAAASLLWLGQPALAALHTETVDYRIDDETFSGYLAFDDSSDQPRPGVLVVHEWWGHNEFARQQAERLAAEGYTAFALDMYGDGKLAEHPEDAMAFAKAAKADPERLRQRFLAAMAVLKNHHTVASDQIAAQGYCFGGSVVLDMARQGVELTGVVSIHGALTSTVPAQPGKVKARVQVYTGGADQLVPASQVAGLVEEMQTAGVDLTITSFPGVQHSFSNPDADQVGERFDLPLGYDEDAAQRTWDGTLAFYRQLFER
ncbi:MAG: dienelactone hydrolase family protein [Pseudomonadales bacterium]|nr:dienelactone hydrolase family protein [Pseudomonadales bacterium]